MRSIVYIIAFVLHATLPFASLSAQTHECPDSPSEFINFFANSDWEYCSPSYGTKTSLSMKKTSNGQLKLMVAEVMYEEDDSTCSNEPIDRMETEINVTVLGRVEGDRCLWNLIWIPTDPNFILNMGDEVPMLYLPETDILFPTFFAEDKYELKVPFTRK